MQHRFRGKINNKIGRVIKLTYKPSLERYTIFPDGKLINNLSGRSLTTAVDGSGYAYYTLSVEGKIHKLRVHILVARAFIDNDFDQKLMVVNHRDCRKNNNHLSNLEIISYSANTKHYYDNKGVCDSHRENNKKVPIIVTEDTMNLI